ncbi:MAG: hypothetical protein GY679_00455 [Mycoplasma sp.]|nr:hypothetical protein [Mycoplasma sp.]
MKVIKFPNLINEKNTTIILGSFSMFHLGHLDLLKIAKNEKQKIVLFIFDKPEKLPNKTNLIFEQLSVRLQKAANLNIDYSIIIETKKENVFLSAKEFINKLKQYNPLKIICGNDYKFGHNAKGNIDLLKKYFDVDAVKPVKINNIKISSSIIKEQISFGEIKFCNSLMTEPWTIKVNMKSNNTFELEKEQVKPHNGIYAITLELKSILYHGVCSVNKGIFKLKLLNYKLKIIPQNSIVVIRWIQEIKISINEIDNKITQEQMEFANKLFKKT